MLCGQDPGSQHNLDTLNMFSSDLHVVIIPSRVIHPFGAGKGVLDRMVRLTGRGAASGMFEQIEAYFVGMRTENRIPYKIPALHTLSNIFYNTLWNNRRNTC